MDIRQLQYLVALAREKHFTRAAQACHVTQPTLSGRIRQLEQELGVPIVERGQRFHGLTREGEPLSGRLSIGVIPSASPMAGLIGKALRASHPEVELTVCQLPINNPE
jgi:Bacterial regulatory helix-turn-helix protein, lysR family